MVQIRWLLSAMFGLKVLAPAKVWRRVPAEFRLKWLVYSSTDLRVPVALWHIIYSILFCWCFMMFFSATVR